MSRAHHKSDRGDYRAKRKDRGVSSRLPHAKSWHVRLFQLAIAGACLALWRGKAQQPPVPIYTVPPLRTNLGWDPSPTPGVTYVAIISNEFGVFSKAVATNFWGGVLTNRASTRVEVSAISTNGLRSDSAITNFFVVPFYRYEIYAQTGTLTGGFSDWKPLGVLTNSGPLLFRLRAQTWLTNQ